MGKVKKFFKTAEFFIPLFILMGVLQLVNETILAYGKHYFIIMQRAFDLYSVLRANLYTMMAILAIVLIRIDTLVDNRNLCAGFYCSTASAVVTLYLSGGIYESIVDLDIRNPLIIALTQFCLSLAGVSIILTFYKRDSSSQ